MWFGTFRVGIWPEYFPGVQFLKDPEALNQYFRQMTPNVVPYDAGVNSDAFAALFNKIGPTVFVTRSQGGGLGWLTVLKTGNVRGIVSYEPGSGFLFPEGEAPEALPSSGGTLEAIGAPVTEFKKLDQDSRHHLLRRFHSGETQRQSRPGWMASSAADGAKVARHRQPARWRT
jgi:hypothetical protein